MRNKTTLYTVVLILWLGLIAGLVVYPLWGKVRVRSEQLIQNRKEIVALETQSQQLDKLQQEKEEFQQSFDRMNKLFVDKEAPVEFLEFLERTALDSEVSLDIQPASGRKLEQEPWPPTFFKLSGRGKFENCADFLAKLEQSPYLIRIQSLDFQQVTSEQEEIERTKFNFSIKVY